MKSKQLEVKYFQNAMVVRDELNKLIPNHSFYIELNPDNSMWKILTTDSEFTSEETKTFNSYRRKIRSLSSNKENNY